MAIRLRLNGGDIIKNPDRCLSHVCHKNNTVEEDGYFHHRIRFNRDQLIAGLFYALNNTRLGGYRKVAISPHLAYDERGIAGIIPANAKIIAEIKALDKI